MAKEYRHYNPENLSIKDLPLTNLWSKALKDNDVFIAHALLKPINFGDVYFDIMDYKYYGFNRKQRVDDFLKHERRKPAVDAI